MLNCPYHDIQIPEYYYDVIIKYQYFDRFMSVKEERKRDREDTAYSIIIHVDTVNQCHFWEQREPLRHEQEEERLRNGRICMGDEGQASHVTALSSLSWLSNREFGVSRGNRKKVGGDVSAMDLDQRGLRGWTRTKRVISRSSSSCPWTRYPSSQSWSHHHSPQTSPPSLQHQQPAASRGDHRETGA